MKDQGPWSKLERAVDRQGDQAWNFLESDEIDRLLDVLRVGCPIKVIRSNGRNYETHRPPSPNVWKMVVFLLNTGARRGEMFRLRWSDVDLARGRVRLVSTKSARPGSPAKTRYIPFNAALDEMFQGLNRGKGSELVFGRDRNLRQKFKAALGAAGLRSIIRVHDLRHTFASHLVMNGVPLYTVSELLGHSSTHMTRRYAHLAPETLESAVAKLNFGERPDGARVLSVRG